MYRVALATFFESALATQKSRVSGAKRTLWIFEFMQTGLVPRLPTAVLTTGLVLLSFLSFTCGLVLDSVTRGRKEIKRIAYLGIPTLDVEE